MSRKIISLNRLTDIAKYLLIIGASCYLLFYLIIVLERISYPFELEWMEGGSVVQVQRVLNNQSLYVAPSLDYVPYIYPPLYFYVSSFVARVTGNGFLPLRLVSFLASIGCFALIYMIVYRRTSSRFASFIAMCLFAATFRISGAWYDIARIDSLFLFLLLACIYLFGSSGVFNRTILSTLFLFLSYFTKQPALIVGACIAISTLITSKRSERFLFPIIFFVLVAASIFIMNGITDGWYKYYIFDLPARHDILKIMLVKFWTNDIAKYLAIAFCLCIIPFLGISAEKKLKSDRVIKDILIFGGLLLASYFSRIHPGGYDNVLMPAYAGIAIYFGIGLAFSLKAISENSKIRLALFFALIIQFVALIYNPIKQIPSDLDKEQGAKLERTISGIRGEVYMSTHPWYLGKLRKPVQAQDMAVIDVLRASGTNQWKKKLEKEMINAITEEKYDAFIVDNKDFVLRVPDFEDHYKLVKSDLSDNVFHPVTGKDSRPTYLYVRKTIQQ